MHAATRTETARNALRTAGIEALEARATQHDVTTIRVYTAPHYAPTNGADAETALRTAFDGVEGIRFDVFTDPRQTRITIYDYAATAAVFYKAGHPLSTDLEIKAATPFRAARPAAQPAKLGAR